MIVTRDLKSLVGYPTCQFESGLGKKAPKSSIVSWSLFINPPGYLNRQIHSLQYNKDIDKLLLHFQHILEGFTTIRRYCSGNSLKIQYAV